MRKRFHWLIELTDMVGNQIRYEIHNFWSPHVEGNADEIGRVAAIQAGKEHGREFVPVKVTYVEGEIPAN